MSYEIAFFDEEDFLVISYSSTIIHKYLGSLVL